MPNSRWLLPAAAGAVVAIYVVMQRMSRKVVLTYEVLKAEDSVTTTAIIDAFTADATFQTLAKAETSDILKRDAEDDEKLAAGIKARISIEVETCGRRAVLLLLLLCILRY
jgi:hypothetical protein